MLHPLRHAIVIALPSRIREGLLYFVGNRWNIDGRCILHRPATARLILGADVHHWRERLEACQYLGMLHRKQPASFILGPGLSLRPPQRHDFDCHVRMRCDQVCQAAPDHSIGVRPKGQLEVARKYQGKLLELQDLAEALNEKVEGGVIRPLLTILWVTKTGQEPPTTSQNLL